MNRTKLWIGGGWVEASHSVPLKNPHTGDVLAQVGYASPVQTEDAIEAAHQAFLSFRKLPIHQRSAILTKASQIISARREEFARQITLESGKPIRAARGEVDRTAATYQFAAEAAKNLRGETIPMDAAPRGEQHIAFTERKALGVVAAITPFNFPLNLVAHKVGPAIAAGNAIVLKPAEQTPLSALLLAEVFADAGLPDGVLNIVPGYGHELGETLTTHPLVQFVTFTGSPRVGKLIRQQAGLKRVTLELGSNAPLIIDGGLSGPELDCIAAETTSGAFSYNGQVCISIQRVFVHASVYDGFVQRLVQCAMALQVGNPLDETTDITALINDSAVQRLRSWLKEAVTGGAKVLTGGQFEGNVLTPTVLTDVPANASLRCEEAFGPLVVVTPFETWQDAIDLANQSKYGLHAGVFTKDLERAFYAAEALESGGVLINQVPTYRVDHMPYGGVKESGIGREGVQYALEEMTELKVIGLRTGVFTESSGRG